MGNKASKGGSEEQAQQQAQQPTTQQTQQPAKNLNVQKDPAPVPTSHPPTPQSQQSGLTSPANTAQTNGQGAQSNAPTQTSHLESGLAEFGNTENISALESCDHWNKNAAPSANGQPVEDNIGGANKVRNKELQQTMRQTMRNTMCNGDLRQLVKLPPNADLNEWIALNTIHFYRTCSQIGETYRDLCTPQSCPLMSAGNVEYLWKDDKEYTKPARVPACMYMEFALREAYATIEDSNIFPADETQPFAKNFLPKVKEIFKRLFRQFAHLYYSHYDEVKASGSSKHLNSTFKHFIYFVLEFQLIDQQTLSPLQKFIDHIVQNPQTSNAQ